MRALGRARKICGRRGRAGQKTTPRTKSEKRGVQAARNGPSEDSKCWQRVELGIHWMNRWTVKCLDVRFVSPPPVPIFTRQGLTAPDQVRDLRNGDLEMSRKRGVRTDKTPRVRTEVLAAR